MKIFVESESRAFAKNFEAAAGRIKRDLAKLEASLDQSIRSMGDQLGWAEYKLNDTESTLDTILSYSRSISDNATDISARLRALFRQDSREDPVRAKIRKATLDKAVEEVTKDPKLLEQISTGKPVTMTADGKAAVELTKDELRTILSEAVSIASTQKASAQTEKMSQKKRR